jgi:hypothetical protein
MEAACTSETSVDFQRTTRRHIPEDTTLHDHCYEGLKSKSSSMNCTPVDININEYMMEGLDTMEKKEI